jgi:hypothetical protein
VKFCLPAPFLTFVKGRVVNYCSTFLKKKNTAQLPLVKKLRKKRANDGILPVPSVSA